MMRDGRSAGNLGFEVPDLPWMTATKGEPDGTSFGPDKSKPRG
jgi:hypothetical protein